MIPSGASSFAIGRASGRKRLCAKLPISGLMILPSSNATANIGEAVNPAAYFCDERVLQTPNWSQPGPTTLCPGWPLSVCACPAKAGKETTMITAHKKLYENHAKDLTARKKLYEHHAKDCVRVAELELCAKVGDGMKG
jgi:hypothetical protein